MFYRRCLSLGILLAAALVPLSGYGQYLDRRPDYAGVWINLFGRPENLEPYLHFLAGEASKPKWSHMEATRGVFCIGSA